MKNLALIKTKFNLKKTFFKGLIACLVLFSTTFAFAENLTTVQPAQPQVQAQQIQQVQDPQTGKNQDQGKGQDIDQTTTPLSEKDAFLERLQDELNMSKIEYQQVTRGIKDTRSRINSLKDDTSELQKQLMYFDDQISVTNDKLVSVLRQLSATENEIALLYDDIDVKQTALNYQKSLLQEYMKQLYVNGDTYFAIDKDGQIDAFKLLLADNQTGDVLKDIKYLGLLEETGSRLMTRLDKLTKSLGNANVELENKKSALQNLQTEFTSEKTNLETQKQAKANMMAITRAQDEIYRNLLKESMAQQDEAMAQVKAFEESIKFIKDRMAAEGDTFDVKKYETMLGEKFTSVYEFQKKSAGVYLGLGDFIWPVMPENGLSAFFHDPSYQAYFGVSHNAVDVRTPQNSPVHAVADSVVYQAKDNGYGYSYITLVHAGNVMTVYGHISSILVKEGQVVSQGDIIGLSGGMPGTLGAGYMTTGPHLHLEFISDGAYVDPLRFLPLEALNEEAIGRLPESYRPDWEKAVFAATGIMPITEATPGSK